jgi:hypothetical protein
MGKRPKGRPRPRKEVEVPAKRKIKADPALWSKQSKQSYSYYDTKEYEDIEYVCWRCKKPDVFTAEDQKHSYEVKKNYFWQRRILCRSCWMEANKIRESLAKHDEQWPISKAKLRKDTTFLSGWLELLLKLEEYVPYRANRAKKAMLTKLLKGNA